MIKYRGKHLSREERIHRKRKRISTVLLIAVGLLLLWGLTLRDNTAEQQTPEVPPVPVAEEVEVEVVIVEHDPVREDIPMDAELQRLLYQACEETGVPYELALAVTWRETGFRNITGDNGDSAGYMQVQERWHEERMERYGVTDLMDPYSNFLIGCDYLAELLEKDRGIEWVLHSYNGGQSYANKMEKSGKVSQYVHDVLNYMNNMEEF